MLVLQNDSVLMKIKGMHIKLLNYMYTDYD